MQVFPMFLTETELSELTGYVYRSRQIDWLRRHNWKFEVNAQQKPKVARSYFDARLGVATGRQEIEHTSSDDRPNFKAIMGGRR